MALNGRVQGFISSDRNQNFRHWINGPAYKLRVEITQSLYQSRMAEPSGVLIGQRISTIRDCCQGIGGILWRMIVRKALTKIQRFVLGR